jgi:hypothetical protein
MTFFKSLTLLYSLLFITGCGSGTNPGGDPSTRHAGPKPAWLVQQPVDPNFYIGIGSASKSQYGTEAMKSAQDLALADLASQITVKITSDIVTTLIQKGTITEEDYLATARSEAMAELEGHELVDTWQDATYHYAYYRLSKAKYAAIQARKRQAALLLSADFLEKATSATAMNQVSQSFNLLVQAFIPLLPYLNEALAFTLDGQNVILSNEVNSRLHDLLSGINLTPSKSNLTTKLGQPIREKLTVTAKGSDHQLLADLPLKVRFKRGAGEVLQTLATGPDGIAVLEVSTITSPLKLQVLEISVDMKRLTGGIESPVLTGILKSIPPASTRIVLDVVHPTIYLESNELYDGRTLTQLQVEPRIKNHFMGQGFNFVDNPQDSDWHMTLHATAIRGTEYSGMFTCFADVSLNVIDRKSGQEVYKNSLSRVKGIDLNYTAAANKAFNSAADEMIVDILPQILESMK